MTDLKKVYDEEIRPRLKEELGLDNVMEIPRITKITLNMGVGESIADRKLLDAAVSDMELIAGQKAVVTKQACDSTCLALVLARDNNHSIVFLYLLHDSSLSSLQHFRCQ